MSIRKKIFQGWQNLFSQVDIASLVFFRIAFGAILHWEVWRFFLRGQIKKLYIDPTFQFTYYGFSWVHPWPGNGMNIHFLVLGFLSLCIMLGLFYRATTTLFFIGFTYVFLLDQANYLNHFYFISLISFLMILVPAHRALSLDSMLRPAIKSGTTPGWAVFLLCFQTGVVYFYAGIAKLDMDWLSGRAINNSLQHANVMPILSTYVSNVMLAYMISYGGLAFDFLIVPMLLWRKTRIPALFCALIFHVINANIFIIGVFPLFMFAATLLYCSPDWPKKIWIKGYSASPIPNDSIDKSTKSKLQRLLIGSTILVFVSLQLVIPLRHHLYPGHVSWTEEGHRFSWRMKLRAKTSIVRFIYRHGKEDSFVKVPDTITSCLSNQQIKIMAATPDMILQFAHYIAKQLEQQGISNVQVYAIVKCSLNGRKHSHLIDPKINLAAQTRDLKHSTWITEFE